MERKINMAKINKTNEAYVEDADLTILADLLSYFIKSLLPQIH